MKRLAVLIAFLPALACAQSSGAQFAPPGGLPASTAVGTSGATLQTMQSDITKNAGDIAALSGSSVSQSALATALSDYVQSSAADATYATQAALGSYVTKVVADQSYIATGADMSSAKLGNTTIGGAVSRPAIQPRSENYFMFASMLVNATGSGQYTYFADYSVDTSFVGIRLILANTSTSAVTLPAMIAAPSASAADTANPVTASGTAQGWTTVTLNSAGAITLPAATSAALPSYTLSDFIPIQSIARTDGGTGYLVYTRFLTQASGYNVSFFNARTGTGSADANLVAAITGGRTAKWGYLGGDSVTNAPVVNTANVLGNPGFAGGVVVGVVYYTTDKTYTLMAVGDSLTQGWQTASDYDGYARYAARSLTSAGYPTSFVDASWTAQSTGQMQARAYALLAAGLRPTFMLIPVDSPNDYAQNTGLISSQPGAQSTAMQRVSALRLADYARSLGVYPIMVTPLPLGTAGQWDSADRVNTGLLFRNSSSIAYSVFDAQAIVCNCTPSLTNKPEVLTSELAGDGAHYTDALQTRLGASLATYIANLIP